MPTDAQIAAAHATIAAVAAGGAPILSSFGKDSMAVIHLAAEHGLRDVLYLEDRDETIDDAHRAAVVKRYGLRVTRLTSGRAVLYFIDGQPYLLGFPFIGARLTMPTPTNVDPYEPGVPFTCVDERLRAEHGVPLHTEHAAYVLGFKRADWDTNTCRIALDHTSRPTYEPLTATGGATFAFPLLDWSHVDVWDYLAANDVPVSPLMYDGRLKRPHANPVCYRCHDPLGPAVVACPKTRGNVMNLAHWTGGTPLTALERLHVIPTGAAVKIETLGNSTENPG